MKAARAAVQPCIVRPLFFSCFLVQRIKLACTGSNEKKIATDRGRRKDSTSCLKLPQDVSMDGTSLPSRETSYCCNCGNA